MSFIDPYCVICGTPLEGWLTESGDNFVVKPCEKGCGHFDPPNFETDEDFLREAEN